MLLILIVALVANFAFSYFFYTPKMWRLRDEALSSVASYELLQKKIALMSEELSWVEGRDRMVYRAIFSQDTVPIATLGWVVPETSYGRYTSLVHNTEAQLHALSRRLYHASLSLDDMEVMSANKDAMAERIPAIWPIDRKALKDHIGAFGMRVHPISGVVKQHYGVDFATNRGVPVFATGAGVVSNDDNKSGYGRQVLLDHGFGYKTRYAHLDKILVKPGQQVIRGEIIGLVGSTGRSTGNHLHYEVIHRGKPVNPVSYFSRDMSSEEFQEILANARQTTYETDE